MLGARWIFFGDYIVLVTLLIYYVLFHSYQVYQPHEDKWHFLVMIPYITMSWVAANGTRYEQFMCSLGKNKNIGK